MDERHHLHHPLLPSATTTSITTGATTSNDDADATSSNFGIAPRILLVLLIGLISTWANQEASKGFMITVTNDMENTSLGEKFSLFYVSNDEVDIRLANRNLARDHILAAEGVGEKSKYVIFISPQVMEFSDFRRRIKREIQRGMAEILLFGIQNGAPKTMLDGMVEYISNLAGVGPERRVFKLRDVREKCWEDEDQEVVAEFLGYCEGKSEGFIGRLSQAVREGSWDEETLDRALGMPAKYLCESFHSSMVIKIQDLNSSNPVCGYR
ncbi:hypothetical protein Cgig2_003095 [Carnegiea gigantea]|uniref:Uncharacterized protein n=1 Tax=Carnegiea gigantea TaxID=171969 RepID=A0A9Q1GPT6_9CARY|nr:hypothetical protein Cgig2_003095 [Carnegiea gigantea]